MKTKFLGQKKGFSLVELMVVVAIIGILTSIAVPKFNSFRAKAIRAEAISSLTNINTLQQLYYTDADEYGTLGEIGFTNTAGKSKYAYSSSLVASNSRYEATATSDKPLCGNATQDVMKTNQDGVITSGQTPTTPDTAGNDGLTPCL